MADPSRLIIGVCAMEKKTRSKPMTQILERIRGYNLFDVILFKDENILKDPIEEWPRVDCLFSFFSTGFPLEKAEAYVAKYKPYTVNDLKMQHVLLDRFDMYSLLEKLGVQLPNYAFMSREEGSKDELVEGDDHIEINGKRLDKPFVEKPRDAEDHNIYIYYPRSAGGGSKRLFRKIENRSSDFYADINEIRVEGSYIYEEFLPTEGTDLKVYTVGPSYAHAEARKSPTVDGRVRRDQKGKEVRVPVLLTPHEKQIARTITRGFKQMVCGFDLLRAGGVSYVCDVNGWSFIKNSLKYYDDCAYELSKDVLAHLRPHQRMPMLVENTPAPSTPLDAEASKGDVKEELVCILGIIRHGDRTPKQKMKMKVTGAKAITEPFLAFFHHHAKNPKKELKCKSAKMLQELLDTARRIVADYSDAASRKLLDGEELEDLERVHQMQSVLEKGGYFSGINRKVQLKPGDLGPRLIADKPQTEVASLTLVLKWGGELTHGGVQQASTLGARFRSNMYPGESLVRLHSTYRHDLKLYSSDEGRVQMTAAAFAKSFLALEGELTPILVSLVSRDHSATTMLDSSQVARDEMTAIKQRLQQHLTEEGGQQIIESLESSGTNTPMDPLPVSSDSTTPPKPFVPCPIVPAAAFGEEEAGEKKGPRPFKKPEPPQKTLAMLQQMFELMAEFCDQLRSLVEQAEEAKALREEEEEDVEMSSPAVDDTSECGGASLTRRNSSRVNPKPAITTPVARLGDRCFDDLESDATTKKKKAGEWQAVDYKSKRRGGGAAAVDTNPKEPKDAAPPAAPTVIVDPDNAVCGGETLSLMCRRWTTLLQSFYHKKKGTFDCSKIPDIYDCLKYDLIHNSAIGLGTLRKLYPIAKGLAHWVGPQEHGHEPEDKLRIGVKICENLLKKISRDLQTACEQNSHEVHQLDHSRLEIGDPARDRSSIVRTRLYFTSESHIVTLLNVLRWGNLQNKDHPQLISEEGQKLLEHVRELNYMSHIVIKLYDNPAFELSDPKRHRMELWLSTGAMDIQEDMPSNGPSHCQPIGKLRKLNTNLTLQDFLGHMRLSESTVNQAQKEGDPSKRTLSAQLA